MVRYLLTAEHGQDEREAEALARQELDSIHKIENSGLDDA
jgi:hypothetical protein